MEGDTRAGQALRAGLAGLALAAAAIVPPLRPLPFDLCLFQRLAERPCLTCGLTRACCLLVQGRFSEGVQMHPAGPIVVALAAGALLWGGAEAAWGRPLWPERRRRLAALLLVAAAGLSILTWVSRLALAA